MHKTVQIHIGLPKTGTTTIQTFLRDNENSFLAEGYFYPGALVEKSFGNTVHHSTFLNAVIGAEIPRSGTTLADHRKRTQFMLEWFRSDPSLHSLVLSHETLSMMLDRWDLSYLYRITDNMNLCFILYARRTDHWIESLHHQTIWGRLQNNNEWQYVRPLRNIEDGRPVRSMDDFSVATIVRKLSAAFPVAKISLRSFDADRENDQLVCSFLSVIDTPHYLYPDATALPQKNPTRPSADTMLLSDLQNQRLGLATLRPIGLALAKRNNRKIRLDHVHSRRFQFLSPRTALQAQEQYKRDVSLFPQLPMPSDNVEAEVEFALRKDDAATLLDWLRPEITDQTFERAISALRS